MEEPGGELTKKADEVLGSKIKGSSVLMGEIRSKRE